MKIKDIMDLLEKTGAESEYGKPAVTNVEEGVADDLHKTTTQEDKVNDTAEDKKAKLQAKVMALAGKELEEDAQADLVDKEEEIEEVTDGLKTAEDAEYYGRFMARGFFDEMNKLGGEDDIDKLATDLVENFSQEELADMLEKVAANKDRIAKLLAAMKQKASTLGQVAGKHPGKTTAGVGGATALAALARRKARSTRQKLT